MNEIITIKMTLDEARQCVNEIKAGINDVGKKLLQLYEGEGWRVLGYATWRECAQEEFGFKQSHAYRLLEFAEVTRNIEFSPMGEKQIMPTAERQIRPLTQLEPEDQATAWQQAVETAPNGKVTAAHVQQVVKSYWSPPARNGKQEDDYEELAESLAEGEEGYDWQEDEDLIVDSNSIIQPIEDLQPVAAISKPHVTNNSGNNEWYTPAEYIDAARDVLGTIDLDPASSDEANQVVKATTYYTINDDGLQQEWCGKVWMNPPYGAGIIDKFISKLVYHVNEGDVSEAIVLVNNATETGWFGELASVASVVVFPQSRIRYWQPESGVRNTPLQGQAFIYIGNREDVFIDNFAQFGWRAVVGG